MMMQPPPPEMVPAVPGGLPGSYVPHPPAAYWAPEAIYLANLQEMILNQVHYYFSTENLLRDNFLRSHMDPDGGWIAISLLASFNRLRSLTTDIGLIAETLKLSPELEVAHSAVRKRHGWQQWVYRKASLSRSVHVSNAGGGDPGTTESSDDAADTAVETGAPPSSPPSSSIESSHPVTAWRDAASKLVAPTSSMPSSTPSAKSPHSSGTATVVLIAPMPQATAPTAAPELTALAMPVAPPVLNAMGSASHAAYAPKPVASRAPVGRRNMALPGVSPISLPGAPPREQRRWGSFSDDEAGQLPRPTDGWETPSLKGKERRRSKSAGSKGGMAVTHLAAADSSLCSGKVQLTDEQRSDETTLIAEEDWASSGTDDALTLSAAASAASLPALAPLSSTAPAVTASAAAPAAATSIAVKSSDRPTTTNNPVVRKRPSSMRKVSEAKGPEKARSRVIKELNDAPPMESQSPGLIASLDFQLIGRHVSSTIARCKGAYAQAHKLVVIHTPHTQALLYAHAHETWFQACFALIVLLLLIIARSCSLPPSLGQLASSRWVEVPLGFALALKFNEVGGRILAGCTPVAPRNA